VKLLLAGLVTCFGILGLLATVATAERLPIKVYTTADGLAGSDILNIVPDSRGFLWFATRNGLSRFDGTEFRNYTTDDGLPHPVVNDFLETSDGEYWIATNGGGVCRFNVDARQVREPVPGAGLRSADGRQPLFTCRPVGSHYLSNRVNVLREDRQRRIWVGTDNGVFQLVRTGSEWLVELVTLEGLPDEVSRIPSHAISIHEDRKGRIWIGLTNGLLRLDANRGARLYTMHTRSALDVRPIVERDGVIWVGTTAGLLALWPEAELPSSNTVTRRVLDARRDCVTPTTAGVVGPSAEGEACLYDVRDGLPGNGVTTLATTRAGRLWIGTSAGLAYLEGAHITNLGAADQRVAVFIGKVVEDRSGQLWMGAVGAIRLTPDALVSYGPDDGLGNPRVHRFFEPPGGALFAVSGEWVVNKFDGRRFEAIKPQVPEGSVLTHYSHGAFLDSRGSWWLLTSRGLYRLRAGTTIDDGIRQPPQAVYTTRNGLPADLVIRMFEDSRGDLWIATRSGESAVGLSRWKRASEEVRVFGEGFGTAHQFPVAFTEDRRGAVWIGFEGGGLARYYDDRFLILGPADGVPPDVTDVYVDGTGQVWIASASAGVSMIADVAADRPLLVRYTTADGLSTNNIQCLTEDRLGRIYFGTARGIDRLDPSSGRVKHFTTSDGLAADYVTAAFRDSTGALWFGTRDGVSRLVPGADGPSAAPAIWIGEVRAGGVLQATPELGAAVLADLTIEPAQNHLQIVFFGVGYAAGGPLRYRYRLVGADSDWSGPTDQRVVHYAGLGPGRYRFVVEAITADGVTSEQPATVSFVVLPPVWQRWWFLTLVAMSLATMAYAFHRVRLARLLALERVRARIAADLHDDLGGSLSRIAIQSEVARREVAAAGAGAPDRRLEEVGETARRVVESLADVVWSVDPVQDDLASVERRVREYAADVLGAHGVRWTFHGTAHLDRFTLDPEARRDLLLLLKEGITNIARHANARVASLHLRVSGNRLHAELQDDGRGFEPAVVEADGRSRGHGLANMGQRARQLGATLEISSHPGTGTRVAVVVPLRHKRRMNMRLWRP
jgi:ligand-binding sensor domain-containing protein/signal transduction histidine kinase